METTETTKHLNPYLIAANIDREKYFPISVNSEGGEVTEYAPIPFPINSVQCFDVAHHEPQFGENHNSDTFRATRIGLNSFFLERITMKIGAKFDSINWSAGEVSGEVFCPLLLGWGCSQISNSSFEKTKKTIFELLKKPPSGEQFQNK